MGPTKVIVKGDALYEARTSKLIKEGLSTQGEREEYAAHHYIALPVCDNAGRPWVLEGQPVYCFRGSKYETVDDKPEHLRRCPDCGGMATPVEEEGMVERDCVRCTQCNHEFDARLEMMES